VVPLAHDVLAGRGHPLPEAIGAQLLCEEDEAVVLEESEDSDTDAQLV